MKRYSMSIPASSASGAIRSYFPACSGGADRKSTLFARAGGAARMAESSTRARTGSFGSLIGLSPCKIAGSAPDSDQGAPASSERQIQREISGAALLGITEQRRLILQPHIGDVAQTGPQARILTQLIAAAQMQQRVVRRLFVTACTGKILSAGIFRRDRCEPRSPRPFDRRIDAEFRPPCQLRAGIAVGGVEIEDTRGSREPAAKPLPGRELRAVDPGARNIVVNIMPAYSRPHAQKPQADEIVDVVAEHGCRVHAVRIAPVE